MIKYCQNCNLYTLKNKCKKCGGETKEAHPPKSSLSISFP
ncbi:MAG: nucleolar RNA-binding Nop10p family protein [Candidatus Aenigmarchaeota archaeon]|nr:RNA-protein complex protein Nop10 [Candidatus Aenigmarchaeota archaeon]MDW8149706.1 nucleolar RNA-binding Nop10p family protein [Candidatus Aenigmarchaeota archaeon]